MNNKLSIKIKIAGREQQLIIDRYNEDEEEIIRKAAKQINQRIAKYAESSVKANDLIDYLSMVCLHFATESIKCNRRNEIDPLVGEIKKIEEKLGNFMENL